MRVFRRFSLVIGTSSGLVAVSALAAQAAMNHCEPRLS
jgi:hypothetical protein